MSPTEREASRAQAAEVAAFLRALAARAERDTTFAAHIAAALAESGLLTRPNAAAGESSVRPPKSARARAASMPAPAADEPAPVDPFTVYRAQGADHLRATLEALDLPSLRTIIRTHRLDPARITARWTNRDRLIALIVDQVKARANHGRAFERV